MRLLITHEIHATEVNGKFYNPDGVIEYKALCNYRFAVKDLLAVLRCRTKNEIESQWLRIDGEGVSVYPIPNLDFNSPLKVFFLIPRAIKQGLKAIKSCDRYMVRLPGPTGTLIATLLRIKGKKYSVELAGDPKGVFIVGKGTVRFQRLYGLFAVALYKYLIKQAYCVGYRSDHIRKLYPNKSLEHEWVFSGAQLYSEAIGSPRATEWFNRSPFKIIFVGRMVKQKGVMYLLKAFRKLREISQNPMELHFVGDGPELRRLREEAHRSGIENQVCFHGRVKRGPELFALLDKSHCFVLPTFPHHEGMPRSLIEAMARGVPSFASDVDAIPELLDRAFLFPPYDTEAIIKKILPLLDTPEKLADISSRCFEASKKHWPEALATAKQGFWEDVVKVCK